MSLVTIHWLNFHHNALSPAIQPVFQMSFVHLTKQYLTDLTMEDHAKSLAEIKVNITLYCLSIHKASHFIIKRNQIFWTYFASGTSTLAVSSHPLVFHVHRNSIQEDLFHILSAIRGEAAWPLLFPFFKMNVLLALFLTLEIPRIACYHHI